MRCKMDKQLGVHFLGGGVTGTAGEEGADFSLSPFFRPFDFLFVPFPFLGASVDFFPLSAIA